MTSRSDGNGDINFGYDGDGRLTTAYKFDWMMGFQMAEYRYDALGRRVYKSEPNDLPTSYTYDGDNLLFLAKAGAGRF